MKRILICLLTIVFCIGVLCLTAAAAKEDPAALGTTVDFDTVDWDTIVWHPDLVGPLSEWYQEQGLNKLFCVYHGRPAWDYAWGTTLSERLLVDPGAFMRALAKEDAQLQEDIVDTLVGGIYHDLYPGGAELPKKIYSTRLSENDPAEVEHILTLFKDAVESRWGIPKTGDPVLIPVALMLTSGLGCGLLVRKIKE